MSRLPAPIAMVRELVAIPSVSAHDPALDQSNRRVVDQIANWASDLGFAIEVAEVPDQPGKYNLIATLGQGSGGLVLSGHTDTVPFDEGKWASDPFTLTERGDRAFGLGAADMKSFFAVALEAMRRLDVSSLRRPLVLLATADEETTMGGARALVAANGPRQRHAVIGEPTGLRPIRMHKGIAFERLRLVGQSGHSSQPEFGRSALEGMHLAIRAILDYREEIQRDYRDEHFEVPVPTINLGRIHGGDAANRICASCELDLDIRPVPGLSLDVARSELRARIAAAVDGLGLEVDFGSTFPGIDAFETPATAAIVKLTEELTGQEAGAVMFGTESPFMQQLGMDTVVLGVGDISVAHQPNEYLPLASLEPGIDLYARLIHRLCVA